MADPLTADAFLRPIERPQGVVMKLAYAMTRRQFCEIVWLIASEHLYNMTNIGLNIHSDMLCDIGRKSAPEVTALSRHTPPFVQTWAELCKEVEKLPDEADWRGKPPDLSTAREYRP